MRQSHSCGNDATGRPRTQRPAYNCVPDAGIKDVEHQPSLNLIFKMSLNYVHTCLLGGWGSLCMYECKYPQSPQEGTESFETGVTGPTCVLGTEFRSYARAVHTNNCGAVSPNPNPTIFLIFMLCVSLCMDVRGCRLPACPPGVSPCLLTMFQTDFLCR